MKHYIMNPYSTCITAYQKTYRIRSKTKKQKKHKLRFSLENASHFYTNRTKEQTVVSSVDTRGEFALENNEKANTGIEP